MTPFSVLRMIGNPGRVNLHGPERFCALERPEPPRAPDLPRRSSIQRPGFPVRRLCASLSSHCSYRRGTGFLRFLLKNLSARAFCTSVVFNSLRSTMVSRGARIRSWCLAVSIQALQFRYRRRLTATRPRAAAGLAYALAIFDSGYRMLVGIDPVYSDSLQGAAVLDVDYDRRH